MRRNACVAMLVLLVMAVPRAQDSPADAVPRTPFDQILDSYVRDGYVYYRTLRSERAKLRYLRRPACDRGCEQASRQEQMAFWLNAYNALVLRTVIDHYPMP